MILPVRVPTKVLTKRYWGYKRPVLVLSSAGGVASGTFFMSIPVR